MTIEKNIWPDIQDGVTQGLAAAELVNDNKRAVNEVIDVVNGLGTAATRDVGSASNQIPLNSALSNYLLKNAANEDSCIMLGTTSSVLGDVDNSIELSTTNEVGGGTYQDHTGARLVAFGMDGWGSAKLGVQISTDWREYGPVREIYHTGNIVGTVSQSGGVPTGAIIQRGSNANGEFVRYADGTQICTHKTTVNRVTLPGGKQNNFLVPASPFVGTPSIYKSIEFCGGTYGAPPYLYTFGTTLGRFVNSGQPWTVEYSWPPAIGDVAANSEIHTLIAIGRWY